MGFTFRYFLPGIVGLLVVAGDYLSKRHVPPQLAALAILVQVTQSAFLAERVQSTDYSLTPASLRDKGSVSSYAEWMDGALKAGEYLRTISRPDTRVMIGHGLATGAITDAYVRNGFYAPNEFSKYADLRACGSNSCLEKFDYVISGPDKNTWPDGFELEKDFLSITILRRRD
jgi:hypothetical protein